ncbi:hypothetical protein Bca52824_049431 [Brassica carinata]|uniref:E3 ubiquitin-protein ligase APD1-4 middle domain-containing protein n=1 Tax=Brassica carinata TaxID=52824 RepID=A0A8X7RKV5_BRACI|nr:hypothetical protein Bca52824_049431 [Brassica carinata]
MPMPVSHPTNVWIGPNASMLVEPNFIFIKSIKVENVYGSEPGLQLFGFYASPPVAVMNWSESRLESVSHRSYGVELYIDVKAAVYDTKEPPFYKCNFGNSVCTFNTMPFVGTSFILTSPAHRQFREYYLENKNGSISESPIKLDALHMPSSQVS